MSEHYWGEADFPTTEDMIKAVTELKCPTCNSPMVMRWRKVDMQPFFSCSRFHEDGCRGAINWTGSTGFTNTVWEDTLKKEGKIDSARTEQMNLKNMDKREGNAEFWQKRFEEERAFVMQQLHDIKNAYGSLRNRVENLEQPRGLPIGKAPEDDIPF